MNIIKLKGRLAAIVMLFLSTSLVMSGCADNGSNETDALLTSIEVTPVTSKIIEGAPQQFKATGHYDDGSSSDITAFVNWSTSDESSAIVDSNGLGTGVAAGSSVITAKSGELSDSADLDIVVNPIGIATVSQAVGAGFTGYSAVSGGKGVSVSVVAGTLYSVSWDDSDDGSGNYTADICLSAYYADGTTIIDAEDSGYDGGDKVDGPQLFLATQSGTVLFEFDPYDEGTVGLEVNTITPPVQAVGEGFTGYDPLEERYVSVPVVAGTIYSVSWDDACDGSGTYTACASVNAFNADGTQIFEDESGGYSHPQLFVAAQTGTVLIEFLNEDEGETIGLEVKTVTPTAQAVGSGFTGYDVTDGEVISVPVVAGNVYSVRWDNDCEGSGSYTACGPVDAYLSNGVQIIEDGYEGYSEATQLFAVQSGTLIIVFNRPYYGTDAGLEVTSETPTVYAQTVGAGFTEYDVQEPVYVSIAVEAGTTYSIAWDDGYDGSGAYDSDLLVTAYNVDGTVIFEEVDSGYDGDDPENGPQTFRAKQSGTVIIVLSPFSVGLAGLEVTAL